MHRPLRIILALAHALVVRPALDLLIQLGRLLGDLAGPRRRPPRRPP